MVPGVASGTKRAEITTWLGGAASISDQEVLMRILALAIFGAISISPAAAQTYDTGYPVCLRARGNYE